LFSLVCICTACRRMLMSRRGLESTVTGSSVVTVKMWILEKKNVTI